MILKQLSVASVMAVGNASPLYRPPGHLAFSRLPDFFPTADFCLRPLGPLPERAGKARSKLGVPTCDPGAKEAFSR